MFHFLNIKQPPKIEQMVDKLTKTMDRTDPRGYRRPGGVTISGSKNYTIHIKLYDAYKKEYMLAYYLYINFVHLGACTYTYVRTFAAVRLLSTKASYKSARCCFCHKRNLTKQNLWQWETNAAKNMKKLLWHLFRIAARFVWITGPLGNVT